MEVVYSILFKEDLHGTSKYCVPVNYVVSESFDHSIDARQVRYGPQLPCSGTNFDYEHTYSRLEFKYLLLESESPACGRVFPILRTFIEMVFEL